MKTTTEILGILKHLRPQLTREYGVSRVALFGSYARGEQRDDSDVDILVEVEPSIGLRFVDLADKIEEMLGIPSEVVSRRAISPRLWALIQNELINVA